MGLKLSEETKDILSRAEEIARKNRFLGVEHIFLALVERERSLLNRLLSSSGVSIDYVLQELENFCWPTSDPPVWREFIITPRMKNIGKIAEKEALDCRSMRVEPVHYLMAVIKEGRGVVPLALINTGLNIEDLLTNLASEQPQSQPGQMEGPAGMQDIISPSSPVGEIKRGPVPHQKGGVAKKEDPKDILNKYGRDLVALCKERVYKITDKTIEDIRQKNNNLGDKILTNKLKHKEFQNKDILRGELKKCRFSDEEINIILSANIEQSKVDPVVGRKEETLKLIQVLTRRGKNNPVIIGEPGVGKTALVMALAQRIANDKVPDMIKGKKVIELSMASLVAGAKHRGDFEERLEQLLKVTVADPNIILFIDEIHTIVGAGDSKGGMDAANILKPAMARGDISLIGATTIDEYKYIEKDPALERRFQPVQVNEPSEEEAVEILKALKTKLEIHHDVEITDEAISAAVKFSTRYLTERYLPDKAIDILDEACSSVKVRQSSSNLSIVPGSMKYNPSTGQVEGAGGEVSGITKITDKDIAGIISLWTSIPVNDLTADESVRLGKMEEFIKQRVKGQDKAIHKVSQVVKMARLGLANPGKPQGVFLFLGSTGVGKTELAKGIAEFIFGSEDELIRLDMSEFKEKHSISKLIGSPAGYVGYEDEGKFTKLVRTKPYSVVLLDEVEKAHPEVFDIFLQVFDEGRLTDQRGRVINFCNTIIILTSNLAVDYDEILSKVEEEKEQFGQDCPIDEEMVEREHICEKLQAYFRPEFLNRIDEIIIFNPLSEEVLKSIAQVNINSFLKRLKEEKNIILDVKPEVVKLILKYGYNPRYGARPLKRAVQRFLINAFAQKMLDTEFKQGDRVISALQGEKVIFIKEGQEKLPEKRSAPSDDYGDDDEYLNRKIQKKLQEKRISPPDNYGEDDNFSNRTWSPEG